MSAAADRALWEKLTSAGVATGEMPASREARTPWYVRVMLGAAGLVAALFLLAFLALGFQIVVDSPAAAAAIGILLIAGAYAMFRHSPHGDFAPMFALAVSIAGQALVVYGLGDSMMRGSYGALMWLVAVLEAGLAYAMPSYLHRVASAYAADIAAAAAAAIAGAGFIAPGALAAALAYLWLNEARLARAHSRVTPIAYGLTLAFIQIEATALIARAALVDTRAAGSLVYALAPAGESLVAAVFVAVVVTLMRRAGRSLHERPALIAVIVAAAIGAASLKATGIAGGLAIVILGFAAGNAVLWGLGIAGLLFYACGYYYLLDLTLMSKSIALAATGLVLLMARRIVLKSVLPHA